MKYSLEDLIKGKVSCINDGTLDELKLVLKTAFPNDKTETSGSYNYYFLHSSIKGEWGRSDKTDKPIQSVKEFVKQINEGMKENNQFATREQIKQIYNIACDAWKNKLLGKINEFPFEKDIPFTDKEVGEMFAACVNDQAETVGKIFKKPEIDKNPFKKGNYANIKNLSEDVFGNETYLQVLWGSTPKNRPELERRAFFVSDKLEVELLPVNDGTAIVFKKK